jgi:tyrosyl-tRNA synthetase
MGRDIQREYGQESQVAFTMPILVGLDGSRKMSKSLGNYVGITEAPGEMFGKMMSIPDGLMWSYYELVTDRTPDEIASFKTDVDSGSTHPMDAKMLLAREVVRGFHGEDAAQKASANFQHVFRDRQAPQEAPAKNLPVGAPQMIKNLLMKLGLATSVSDAERLVKQGAVEIDGQRIDDPRKEVDLSKPRDFLLRAGKKKFVRVAIS